MQYAYCLALISTFLCSVVVSEGFSSNPSIHKKRATISRRHPQPFLITSPMATSTTTATTATTTTMPSSTHKVCVIPPGGAAAAKTGTSLFASKEGGEATTCPFTKSMTIFGSLWGSMGVIYILVKAIRRVLPIAMEPFAGGSLTFSPFQWSMYALSCLFFAYAEGYKGFHLKFAPLVVKRSFTLVIGTPHGNNPINYLLSPLYSMGLFAATRKRLITSWSVTLGVAAIVAMVKRLPIVPRCILDAGVIVGLSLGSLSIAYHFIRSIMTGKLPNVDACLPSENTSSGETKKKD